MYALLFKAAAESLLQLAGDPKRLGAQIGFSAILHTWGQNLLFHPHLHCVVPGGGLAPDGDRWISSRPGYLLPVKVLSRLFRGKFIAGLQQLYDAGELTFRGSTEQLGEARIFGRLCKQLYEKNWVVYSKPPFGGAEQVYRYLGRYTHRVAISNARLISMTADRVRFRYMDYRTGARTEMELTADEFIRRFLLHVLPKRFVGIRHFGILAGRNVLTKLERCRCLLGGDDRSTDRSSSTAPPNELITDTNEPEPELDRCPCCHRTLTRWPLPRRAHRWTHPRTQALIAIPSIDSS